MNWIWKSGFLLIAIFGALLCDCGILLANDCSRLLRLLVLNEEISIVGYGKMFSVQKLRFSETTRENGERKHDDFKLSASEIPFKANGNYSWKIVLEGPHNIEYEVQLPPEIAGRIFQAIVSPPPEIRDSFTLGNYVAGMPTKGGRYLSFTGDLYDLRPGQLVSLGDGLSISRLLATYLGQGQYLTYHQVGGIVVTDMKSIQRMANTNKVTLVYPNPEDKSPAGINIMPLNDWVKGVQFSRPIDWSEYDRAWQRHYTLRAVEHVNSSDMTVAEVMEDQFRSKHPEGNQTKNLGITAGEPVTYYDFQGHPVLSPFRVPLLRTYARNYEAIIEKAIAAGKITENDVFHMARAFRNWKGEELFLRHGVEPPPGYHEIDPTRIPTSIIGRMLAQGFMPISIGRAFHDSRHFEAFAAHPGIYMKPLRSLVRRMGSPDCTLSKEDRMYRVFYALEVLSLVPSNRRKNLLPLLSPLLQKAGQKLITVTEVNAYYAKEPFHEVASQARNLVEGADRLIEDYGGGARDPSLTWQTSSIQAREGISGMLGRLRLLLEHEEGKNLDTKDPNEEALIRSHGNLQNAIRHQLARLEVALKESTRIPVDEFISELEKNKIDRKSKIYRMFVGSEISDEIDGSLAGSWETLAHSIQSNAVP